MTGLTDIEAERARSRADARMRRAFNDSAAAGNLRAWRDRIARELEPPERSQHWYDVDGLLRALDSSADAELAAVGAFHLTNRMAQAAYSAGLRDGPEACMQWLGNALSGPGNCPREGSDPDWYVEDAWSRERLSMPAANATVNEPATEDGVA